MILSTSSIGEWLPDILTFAPNEGRCSSSSVSYLFSLPVRYCETYGNCDKDDDDYSCGADDDCLGSDWYVTNLKKFFINPFSFRYFYSIPICVWFCLILFNIDNIRFFVIFIKRCFILAIIFLIIFIKIKVITWFHSRNIAFSWLNADISLLTFIIWYCWLTPSPHSDLARITCNILIVFQWSKVKEKIVFCRNIVFITELYFVDCSH